MYRACSHCRLERVTAGRVYGFQLELITKDSSWLEKSCSNLENNFYNFIEAIQFEYNQSLHTAMCFKMNLQAPICIRC